MFRIGHRWYVCKDDERFSLMRILDILMSNFVLVQLVFKYGLPDLLLGSFCSWQISLLEMPEHRRKKMTTLTSNVMSDDSDKVRIWPNMTCTPQFNFLELMKENFSCGPQTTCWDPLCTFNIFFNQHLWHTNTVITCCFLNVTSKYILVYIWICVTCDALQATQLVLDVGS